MELFGDLDDEWVKETLEYWNKYVLVFFLICTTLIPF
jgi:hypothetical protein